MNPTLLAKLRNVLAILYPDEASIRRIIGDAELALVQIPLNSTPGNNWHAVLTEAVKINQLDRLLGVVAGEYGRNTDFQTVLATYQRSTGERNSAALGSRFPFQAQAPLRNQEQAAVLPPDHTNNQGPILTWLHLSDLHACKPRTGWDAKRVTDSLIADLKRMQKQQGLRPDLIFFTGDAAFGEVGKNRGELIADQFREAHDFLTAVREAFDPPVEQRNLFLVPGNHDVNRTQITQFETAWLNSISSLDEITALMQKAALEWRSLMRRLDDYAHFLSTYGYDHLLTGRERLLYADAREVAGLRVGIAGFNSSWSSRGAGREEMGRLWMAGRFQLETLRQQLPPNDFAIALLHHPANWLTPEENPSFGRMVERDFPFVLHGHEHQEFVRMNGATGHTVLSAGACHEWSEGKHNGYNFVRLDFARSEGEVWLRQYDATGGGWCPRVVFNQTDDAGCQRLTHLHLWMKRLAPTTATPTAEAKAVEAAVTVTPANAAAPAPSSQQRTRSDPAADYERRYRKAVVDRLDYIQLFGIDLPKEAKEYSLSVAYVSLNLADEEENDSADEEMDEAEDEATLLSQQTVFSAEQVFDQLCPAKHLLLIRGEAGSGKTTLLRWAAVQAGKQRVVVEPTLDAPAAPPDALLNTTDLRHETVASQEDNWRSKVPFVIRLRDYPNGQLPRPREFPLLLAKELPDPPVAWVDELLRNGRALIMFDGVDEVPSDVRINILLPEIRQLIQTYRDNYYVVTTRPGADVRQELREMGFVAARVEKMGAHDRDIFIDRWHEAMEVRLRNWGEAVDLRPLAKRLKERLPAIPAVARLTDNPLLCAVVCALHRQRNENLPETPVDLCEKLCEMLLDRRDAERPGFDPQKNLDKPYRQLDYHIRKGLLAKLAHHMIVTGLSTISETEADKQIGEALQSYQITESKPAPIRRALVERSGMLQESSPQTIEFLHNTLKEFLAAERFANLDDFQSLADHAHDPAWQPAILFAVALPRDGSAFATDLLRAILQQTPIEPPAKGRAKEVRAQAAAVRTRQFFYIRCYTNAYQLHDPALKTAFDAISANLVPPRNLTDAEVLAACGEAIIPYLAYRDSLKAAERAACVRSLALIGGSRALDCLKSYGAVASTTVADEFIDLVRKGTLEVPVLATLTNLKELYLSSTQVSDVSALATLTNLTRLYLSSTQVSDVSALATLTNLTWLYLSSTQVSDVSALASLTNLTRLYLGSTQVSNVSIAEFQAAVPNCEVINERVWM